MPNEQLISYIREQQSKGVAKAEISSALLASKWTIENINDAFTALDKSNQNLIPASIDTNLRPKPSIFSRKLIIGILIVLLLVEGGVAMYTYRDKITQYASKVFGVVSSPQLTEERSAGIAPQQVGQNDTPTLSDQSTASPSPSGDSDGLVIGYLWEAYPGSPKFQAVQLPSWGILEKDFGTREYDIYIFDGANFTFYQKARAVVDTVTFPEGGTMKFKVLGIDPKLKICALDTNVTWKLKFSESGQVKTSKTAITTSTPNPTCTEKNTVTLKREADKQAEESKSLPSGFLVPTGISLPKEFEPARRSPRYVTKDGYALRYQTADNAAGITIENEISSLNIYNSYASDKSKVRDFIYQNWPGIILQKRAEDYKITEIYLYWYDGSNLLQIRFSKSDSATVNLTYDDLINMLKTFTRQQ